MQALYTTMQCNGKLYNVHDILSYFCDFDFFSWEKHRLIVSFFERCDNSRNLILSFCKSLRGLPRSACSVWFIHLTILECWQWSRLKFNQSTEILILGFVPFFLKNFYYSWQQENIWLSDWSHAPLKDGNGPLHFGIWPSENFLF